MVKIKEPAVADMFYPADTSKLKSMIESFASNVKSKYEYKTRAVIVPHAGLVYSGELAYDGIRHLDDNIKTIVIFAPAHRVAFDGLSLTTYDEWKTPLGCIEVNQDICKELADNYGAKFYDEGYSDEHSIEIEVPIIQSIFSDIKIVPVLVGSESPQKIFDIINGYYNNPDIGFVISSDLSHFLSDEKAQKADLETASMIEAGNLANFRYDQACGAIGICGLVEFANKNSYSLIRIDMYNSSLASGDKSRVVGYGAWMLYEGEKNKFIKEYYSDYLLNLCKEVILSKFDQHKICTSHPPIMDELGACFVTLNIDGNLRGCIGSIIAHQPFINDFVQNSINAAFRDPRFSPLSREEVDKISVDISILSDPKQMIFNDEQDLLNQMVPNIDGIIIRDDGMQAVYLPCVWEQLPDKEMFLKSLKMKAGMLPDHFSKTFQAYRFRTEYIEG